MYHASLQEIYLHFYAYQEQQNLRVYQEQRIYCRRHMKESQPSPGVDWLYFRVPFLHATFLLTSDLTTHIC